MFTFLCGYLNVVDSYLIKKIFKKISSQVCILNI